MNQRHEIKFVLPFEYYKHVNHLIKLNCGHFKKIYKSRFINNIYFDSIDMKNYYENINGTAERKKIRIRWYGDFFGKINLPTLEIKEKKGMIVSKKLLPFPNILIKPHVSVKNIIQDISKLLHTDAVFIRLLTATIINRYKREYFLSQDKRFRITIDTQQSVSNPKNDMPKA